MVKRGQQSEHSSDKRARSMENLQGFLDTEKRSLVNLIPIEKFKGKESIVFAICVPTDEGVRIIRWTTRGNISSPLEKTSKKMITC